MRKRSTTLPCSTLVVTSWVSSDFLSLYSLTANFIRGHWLEDKLYIFITEFASCELYTAYGNCIS